MTTTRHGPGHEDDMPTTTRRETLIARVVDGEATDAEWAEFRSMAQAEVPAAASCAWRDLAEAQRSQAVLAGAVGAEVAIAEQIDVPARGPRLVGDGSWSHRPAGRVLAWGGWAAVAAAVALAWVFGVPGGAGRNAGQSRAGLIPPGYTKLDSPEDAVKAYITQCGQQGRVVDPVPERLLVGSRPKPGHPGVYEVVYVRQFLERADVADMYRFGQDEAGQARLVPASLAQGMPRSGKGS